MQNCRAMNSENKTYHIVQLLRNENKCKSQILSFSRMILGTAGEKACLNSSNITCNRTKLVFGLFVFK